MTEEKPAVDQRSTDAGVTKSSESLKEKDAEKAMTNYLPQSDEEYNVTLKTWCVVLVSTLYPGRLFLLQSSCNA